jgi:ADP-ribose pyrophosphatase YjhB (NUDIX family)
MITCLFEKSDKPAHLRHAVVDGLIVKDKQILLVKRGGPVWYLEVGKWAMPGGFIEQNETCIQAAIREVREETGYDCQVIRLFQINDNPHRPAESNRQNISFIYLMAPIKKVSGIDHEIQETKWFDLDKLPPPENIAFDHWQTIKKYLEKI